MIDFDQTLQDVLTGQEILDEGAPVSLGTICARALLSVVESDRGEAAELAMDRFTLAQQIRKGGCQEISEEIATKLRARVAAAYTGAAVVGQVGLLLKGSSAPALSLVQPS